MRALVWLALVTTGCGPSLPASRRSIEPGEAVVEYRVQGNVSRPGSYRVPSSEGFCGAIQRAGGLRSNRSVAGAFPNELVVLVVRKNQQGRRLAFRTKVQMSPSCVGGEAPRTIALFLGGGTVVVP